ncbi:MULTISPECIES: hypothetical protein [unclassified Pedobacter]|uniref:hypothetical protein n=1 Tax=unclassified Pedobacter TaxID=2628915 RepID=UPI001420CADC|nr:MULTISPECIES: hypothetical protein [unclassified Pedobacter]NII84252.1 hypothetical protein [Pedobacter sp. SG908]NMN38833.1 hypothetical protein [Pedobacter sp. SG918]
MPEDYQDIVLAAYKKMKDNGKLHAILPQATTTRLRRACLKVYDDRYTPKDADILSMFFKKDKMECDDFGKVIYDSDADDFKALRNHIKGETGKTKEENTDLLAWLIDLEPRPRSAYYLSSDKTIKIGGMPINELFLPPVPPIPPGPQKPSIPPIQAEDPVYLPRFSPRYITVSCIILLLVGTTSFAVWERRSKMVRRPESGEKFMYWDGDHYEPVKDEKQDVGAAIIPLNIQTLTQQRKINLPDTLTSYSIGKVWYKGHGKDHEFFTDSGAYPLDTQRVLKPLSNTILTKYTSNYRYLLTRLVWFLCAAFFVGICGIWASKLKKEVKARHKPQEENSTSESDFSESPLMAEQSERNLAL